ncbi:TPA: transposase [Escherichia coli]|nr:transposase [Escherichia coli]HAV9005610.1 transposase [Escherichia coli]HAW5358450.1 transposase [Escherichia coli]HAW5466435.1 transposase [Escherichia coli]HCH7361857.1 transposase [Escherichia coli]
MELQDWRKEPRKNYSNEFKLRMVELASQPGACVAQIARENGVNDNVIFKWLRLWQNEGRVSRRLPVTTSSDTGVELLPVEITPDEQKEPVAVIAPSLSTSTQTRVSASSCKVEFRHGNMTPSLSTSTQTRVSASSCKVEFRHGNMTLENPSPELLTVLIRELTGRGR